MPLVVIIGMLLWRSNKWLGTHTYTHIIGGYTYMHTCIYLMNHDSASLYFLAFPCMYYAYHVGMLLSLTYIATEAT
jgi:hypothetical protein